MLTVNMMIACAATTTAANSIFESETVLKWNNNIVMTP